MRRPAPFLLALSAPLAFSAAVASCSPRTAPPAEVTQAASATAAPATPPDPAASASSAAPTASAAPAASTAPAASAAPATSAASAASAEPAASAAPDPAAPADAGPLPKVKVANIGMHIGGGPHDDFTKEPIKRSVAPHFDEFRRCFALAEDPTKGGDFGIDLRIERDGGKAEVRKPRTALKGKAFTQCVVGVFERIDFLKPRKGPTVVSYSLRFTP
ncbi:hypothetical protein [Sorangium atrum]|uniref:Secreted protein n=1 Tax=Sorangium atrum TaxID=2995308 RepID=A0ABT5BQK6_9BACT|nr:hypothetical protein [Sorangium aterium]MDC0676442.1 hypothetical protein [Sorangium aterium]